MLKCSQDSKMASPQSSNDLKFVSLLVCSNTSIMFPNQVKEMQVLFKCVTQRVMHKKCDSKTVNLILLQLLKMKSSVMYHNSDGFNDSFLVQHICVSLLLLILWSKIQKFGKLKNSNFARKKYGSVSCDIFSCILVM